MKEFNPMPPTLAKLSCTAAALEVRKFRHEPIRVFFGDHGDKQKTPVTENSVFDLASLTKVIFPTSVLLLRAQEGLPLDIDLRKEMGDLPWHRDWGAITLRNLLSHQAGFSAWRNFSRDLYDENLQNWMADQKNSSRAILEAIVRQKPRCSPGMKVEYSDLGFIFMGHWMERKFGKRLEDIWQEFLQVFGLNRALIFNPIEAGVDKSSIVATEKVEWRGPRLHGEVHDDNTFLMGGVSTHAGIFGTLQAVSAMTYEWLSGYLRASNKYMEKNVRAFTSCQTKKGQEPRGLGWMKPSSPFSTGGMKISPNAVGHLGYAGTSIWIDFERKTQVILLTNRVYGTMTSEQMNFLRASLHDGIWEALG